MLQQGRLQPDCLVRPDRGGPWQQLGSRLAGDDNWLSDELDGSEYLSDFPSPRGGTHSGHTSWTRATPIHDRESDAAVSTTATRSRMPQRSEAATQIEDMIIAARKSRPAHMRATVDDHPARVTRDETQFFIKWGGDEAGPLPREAVQKLADSGGITSDTKTRREDDDNWSTAEYFGIVFAAPQGVPALTTCGSSTADDQAKKIASRERLSGSIMWAIFSPVYYVRAAVSSLASLSRLQLAVVVALVLAIGLLVNRWNNERAHTEPTGVVPIDGETVGNAIVVFSRMATGRAEPGRDHQT